MAKAMGRGHSTTTLEYRKTLRLPILVKAESMQNKPTPFPLPPYMQDTLCLTLIPPYNIQNAIHRIVSDPIIQKKTANIACRENIGYLAYSKYL